MPVMNLRGNSDGNDDGNSREDSGTQQPDSHTRDTPPAGVNHQTEPAAPAARAPKPPFTTEPDGDPPDSGSRTDDRAQHTAAGDDNSEGVGVASRTVRQPPAASQTEGWGPLTGPVAEELKQMLADENTVRLAVRVPTPVANTLRAEVARRKRQVDTGRQHQRTDLGIELFAALPVSGPRLQQVHQLLQRTRRWRDRPRTTHVEFQLPQTVRDHLDRVVVALAVHLDVQTTLADLVIGMLADQYDPDQPPATDGGAKIDRLLRQARLSSTTG